MPRLLVLYGTTDGQTARISHTIADRLRAGGHIVELVDARDDPPDPTDYDAIIVAASVHGGRYQRPVVRWVRSHAPVLAARPTAFVSVCLGILQTEPAVRQELDAIVEHFRRSTGWHPSETRIVAGALLYTKYGWLKRWIMKRIAGKAGGGTDTTRDYEYTDWVEVRDFADRFGERVRAAGRPGSGAVESTEAVAQARSA
jgi:menaquinone-dependent protoporphyrinogen oxidase